MADEVSEDSDEALVLMIICDIIEEPDFAFTEEEEKQREGSITVDQLSRMIDEKISKSQLADSIRNPLNEPERTTRD